MEPKKPAKPLTDEQLWGEPSDDQIIEEMLADDGDDDFAGDDDPNCMYCGRPLSLCICMGDESFI